MNDLKQKFSKHARYWDCYNDEPLNEDHAQRCVEIAIELAREAYNATPDCRCQEDRPSFEWWLECFCFE